LRLVFVLSGALSAGMMPDIAPAQSAPVCVLNSSAQSLFLVVDDLTGQRVSAMVGTGGTLCLPLTNGLRKAVVGVFVSSDALEGCSRLTRPAQQEILLDFAEFDNCRWADTRRGF
jgi:hypothetical protein